MQRNKQEDKTGLLFGQLTLTLFPGSVLSWRNDVSLTKSILFFPDSGFYRRCLFQVFLKVVKLINSIDSKGIKLGKHTVSNDFLRFEVVWTTQPQTGRRVFSPVCYLCWSTLLCWGFWRICSIKMWFHRVFLNKLKLLLDTRFPNPVDESAVGVVSCTKSNTDTVFINWTQRTLFNQLGERRICYNWHYLLELCTESSLVLMLD